MIYLSKTITTAQVDIYIDLWKCTVLIEFGWRCVWLMWLVVREWFEWFEWLMVAGCCEDPSPFSRREIERLSIEVAEECKPEVPKCRNTEVIPKSEGGE
jgi:hypothetical protein